MTHNYIVEGGAFTKVYLRYYVPEKGAIGIADNIREATRYTRDAAHAVSHFLGHTWKPVEIME